MRPGVAILVAAILAMPASALAVGESNGVAFRFEYAPRPGCMGRDDFVDTWLRAAFGGEVVKDDARALVRVEIRRNGTHPEAHVAAFDENGVEHWRAVIPTEIDCRELIQDTAYSLSANLGQWDLKRQPVPEWLLYRKPVDVRTPALSPRPRAFMALVPPAPPIWLRKPLLGQVQAQDSGPRWEVGAAGFVVPLGLPAVGFGGGISVGLRWPRFSLAGEVRGIASLVGDVGAIPASAILWSGLVAPCAETAVRLSICGVGSVGRIYYRTDPRDTPIDTRSIMVMLGLRLAYNWQPLTRLTIRPFFEGMLALDDGPLEAKHRGVVVSKQSPLGPLLIVGTVLAFDGS
ncbi:hypothetical protein [Polyangium aurulentum]|uniref:hypothetical protein n=1 Tax=Polyangium aurulentum TaxID=2567896 RepID=UPI0010AE315A|nr:hypothetical protein [Polyangium aurulentum]UQA61833.1 hypothetical protein E8A73_015720 [Polyangium aurulentum]